MQFIKPITFSEAREKLGRKTPIGSVLDSAAWAKVPVALRERAQFSAMVADVRFLELVQQLLDDHLAGARETVIGPDGTVHTALKVGNRARFIDLLQKFAIENGMGPLDPADAGTMKDITSFRRLALIFDTQTEAANSYAQWKQGMDPDVLQMWPAQRFVREHEVKTPRRRHVDHEGEVHLKTDYEFWLHMNAPDIGGFSVPWGPWGFNSGMGVEDVDREEAESLGLIQPGEILTPPDIDFNAGLKASVTNVDPKLQEWLKSVLGDKVKIEGGAVWWKGDKKGKALTGTAPKKRAKKPAQEPAVPLPAPAPDLAPPPAPPVIPDWPDNPGTLKVIQKLGGSTGAELVEDPFGRRYVLKRGASADHLREEFAADELYRAAGMLVPEGRLYETTEGPVKLAKYVPGKSLGDYMKTASAVDRLAVGRKIQAGFHVDALLGNWDVIGLGQDNVLVDALGNPWRIDNGGSLRYRAQGGLKTAEQWGRWPVEMWSMRSKAENPSAGLFFGDLKLFRVAEMIQAEKWQRLLDAAGPEVRSMLAERVAQMRSLSAKALEYERTRFTEAHADTVVRHILDIRRDGVLDSLAKELVQKSRFDTEPVDADGKPFDNLRKAPWKAQVPKVDLDPFFTPILDAAKNVAYHNLITKDTNYSNGKVQLALLQENALTHLLSSPLESHKVMGTHYLGILKELKASIGTVGKAPPVVVSPMNSQPGKPAVIPPQKKSVVEVFAEWMATRGGDWGVITEWAGRQALDSKHQEPMVVKAWTLERMVGVKPADHRLVNVGADGKAYRLKWGAKFDKTWEMFAAFNQEVLGLLEFPGNDRGANYLRVMRTERDVQFMPLKVGENGVYNRGVNESGSVFSSVFPYGARTLTAVPHTRVTSLYFYERSPGSNTTFLLGDNENEATYIGFDLPALNLGTIPAASVPPPGKTKLTDWGLLP